MPVVGYVPNEVKFTCDACGRVHAPRHIRRFLGECIQCRARSWTLTAIYINQKVTASSLLLSQLSFGAISASRGVETFHDEFHHVSAENLYWICRSMFFVKRRCAQYILVRARADAALERADMIQKGGMYCRSCGLFFMPSAEKPWTLDGCCSKGCYAKSHPGKTLPDRQAPDRQTAAAKGIVPIAVHCACGNTFEAPRAFAGVTRPCSRCGAKVVVPAD